jgi:hypothetical protein
VDGGDITAGVPAGVGAVELVDDLPALQGQRLGDRGGLVLPAFDALEGGRVAVARADVEGRAGALLAGGAEGGGGVGEVQVVDGDGVGPLALEAGQERGDLPGCAAARVRDRDVLLREERPTARTATATSVPRALGRPGLTAVEPRRAPAKAGSR